MQACCLSSSGSRSSLLARRQQHPSTAVVSRTRRRCLQSWRCRAAEGSGSVGGSDAYGGAESTPLPLPKPEPKSELSPSFWLSREQTVEAQLKALSKNNVPHIDHGLETLYRFAASEIAFGRSDYFGCVTLDLGQFERFRRIFYTPYFNTLCNLSSWELLSTLEVAEGQWLCRVHVVNAYRREERDYTFHLEQRLGGRYDGVWYTKKLIAEGCTAQTLHGII